MNEQRANSACGLTDARPCLAEVELQPMSEFFSFLAQTLAALIGRGLVWPKWVYSRWPISKSWLALWRSLFPLLCCIAGHFLLLSKNKSVFEVDAQRWQANEEATDTREVAAHAKLLARIT